MKHTGWKADCGFHRHNPKMTCSVRITSGTIQVKTEDEARLIAAAPDLLETGAELQAARKAQKLSPSAENLSRVRIASDAFDAAIARARGEQSPNHSDTGAQP